MEYYEKIAKILRTDKDVIKNVERTLGSATGKSGVMDQIGRDNEECIEKRLAMMKLSRDTSARRVFDALIGKIDSDDKKLTEIMHNPPSNSQEGGRMIVDFMQKSIPMKKGMFLKKERFIEIVEKEPPQKIMSSLGYKSVGELFANEDWREIAAALRFLEGNEWINNHFLAHYKELTPDDFEEREVSMIAISDKWKDAARQFIKKKYHNISHLKELGVIFIIPTELNIEGELIRSVALLFHYRNEVEFYSKLFVRAFKNRETFSDTFISLLRGDVIEDRLQVPENAWMVVQRYLAKDDEYDWRLFAPHVNPEALHWERAEHNIADIGRAYGVDDLVFWENLNWVGDYFTTDAGVDTLVSVNLVDTAMALVKEKELIKYLYHHQEALWNKIFSSYIGEKHMEQLIQENMRTGIINIPTAK